jgi:hypothetical protein
MAPLHIATPRLETRGRLALERRLYEATKTPEGITPLLRYTNEVAPLLHTRAPQKGDLDHEGSHFGSFPSQTVPISLEVPSHNVPDSLGELGSIGENGVRAPRLVIQDLASSRPA